jgi:L-ascorbate metabolism protein UlaG (beta-lactamase superfamily)
MRVTFINHATALIQMDGVNILTDPVYSDLVGPASLVGPSRVRPPGIRFEDLPPIDVVLISHDHYDHMDIPTLRRLDDERHPRFIAGLGTNRIMYDEGLPDSTDLDWWQSERITSDVRVTFVPSAHRSNRGLCDRDTTLWGGYVISGPSGNAYFAGDTGYGPHFRQIHERFGAIRLALLPIGAYIPRWYMKPIHMDPTDAVHAHQDLGATTSVGIHFGTFRLTDEAQEQPITDLAKALQKASIAGSHFWALGFGEGRDVPPFETPSP